MNLTPEEAKRQIHKLTERELLYRRMLVEAAALFREYAELHLAKGPEHHAKAQRNQDIATRINNVLGV